MNKKLSLEELTTSFVFGFFIVGLILFFMFEVNKWDILVFQIAFFTGFILLFKSIRVILSDFAKALNPPEETLSDFVKGIIESATYDEPKKPKH